MAAKRVPVRKNMRLMTMEGATFCVMAAAGETYFPAFVLALSQDQVASGLVAVVPLLIGSLLQNLAPYGLQRVGSVRRWSTFTVSLQASALFLLCLAAWSGSWSLTAVFLAASLYYGGSYATGPAWNVWAESLIPRSLRARFMARRSSVCHTVQWVSVLLAGTWLAYGTKAGYGLMTFAALFLVAGISRSIGANLLARQDEPVPLPSDYRVLGFKASLRSIRWSREARLLVFMLGLQASLQMAVPFFTPYLLKQLQLGYMSYMLILSTAWLARILTLPILGRWARQWGPRRLFTFAGYGLVPISALWLVCTSVPALILIQAATGALMACYELGVALVYLEAIPARDRTSVLSRFHLVMSTSMLGGSLLGGGLLRVFGEGPMAYVVIFLGSAVARIVALQLLPGGRSVKARAPYAPWWIGRSVAPPEGSVQQLSARRPGRLHQTEDLSALRRRQRRQTRRRLAAVATVVSTESRPGAESTLKH